jgi:hypothetical protein
MVRTTLILRTGKRMKRIRHPRLTVGKPIRSVARLVKPQIFFVKTVRDFRRIG